MVEQDITFTGVIARNSISFVETLFQLNRQHSPIMVLKSEDDDRARGYTVREVLDTLQNTGWASLQFEPSNSDDIAQVAFTSGTEGKPKGILLSYRNQADMLIRLNSVMSVDSTIREYIGVPVYHSFGFGRCRLVASVGGQFYIPPSGFDPLEIQQMLEKGEINAISAVPSLWRVLFEFEDAFGTEASDLKWIEIGSQYMSADEKLRLKKLFPNAVIVQHYGLTEASRATFLSIHNTDDLSVLESVGQPAGDTKVRINSEGKITIKGSLASSAMIKDGYSVDLHDDEGWLVTNDLGELKDGYIYYRGRADDMINCGGIKLYAEAIEKQLRQQLNIPSGIACTKMDNAVRGDGVLVAFEPQVVGGKQAVTEAATLILAEHGVHARDALQVVSVDVLPKTDTGKIRRKELAHLIAPPAPEKKHLDVTASDRDARAKQIQALWQQVLDMDVVSTTESFNDLGGDSLTAISVVLKMKRMGVPSNVAQGMLQGDTITQIVAREFGDTSQAPSVADDPGLAIRVVRGLLVMLVVFAHWSEGIFERLPDEFSILQYIAAPLLAAGTPGFAVMYGVALGLSFFTMYEKAPDRLGRLQIPILQVLGGGILALALLHNIVHWVEGGSVTATSFFNSFYSVLTFYFLATLVLIPLFRFLLWSGTVVLAALVAAVLGHLLYVVIFAPLTSVPATGFIELLKLFVAAKYSFFNMMSGVLLGLAFGYTLRKHAGLYREHLRLLLFSSACIAIAILLSLALGEQSKWMEWPTHTVPAWRWFLYLGACIALMVTVQHLVSEASKSVKGALEVLATIGVLAFPVFVLHKFVIPLKSVLVYIGMPSSLALVGLVGLFFVGMYIAVKRSRALLFASSEL